MDMNEKKLVGNVFDILGRLIDAFSERNYRTERKLNIDYTLISRSITAAFDYNQINQSEWNELIDKLVDIKNAILLHICDD